MREQEQAGAMANTEVNTGEQSEREHSSTAEETEISSSATEEEDKLISPRALEQEAGDAREKRGFDWMAVCIVALIALFFAIVARLNPQVPNSFTPIAVLSASGCGLLITALRKLRTPHRPGLLEAAVGGLLLALLPALTAITAPNVLLVLRADADEQHGFLITWALIVVFSILFSMAGAALGHLAFAPLRPSPAKARKASPTPFSVAEGEVAETIEPAGSTEAADISDILEEEGQEQVADEANIPDLSEPSESETSEAAELSEAPEQPRSFVSYLIAVVLLGLTPTIVGYVFSAAYDYILNANGFLSGPYPTLRLLSAVLPWQVPISVNLGGSNAQVIVFSVWQFWRIPLFLGNPTMFDIVALEPYIFNAAALSLLLFSMRRSIAHAHNSASSLTGWPVYLLLEALLGLLIVLPPALWIVRGLQGLLQLPTIALPIRTLYLLNPLTFTLDLLSGPLVCLLVAVALRLFQARRQV